MSGLDALDRVRKGTASKAAKKIWTRAPFAPIYDGVVLAFDPTLSKTGWAVMSAEYPYVHRTGIIGTKPRDGEEGNLLRGIEMHQQFSSLIASMLMTHVIEPDEERRLLVAHEAAPSGGGSLNRPESAQLASLALRIAAAERAVDTHPAMSNHHTKKRMLGRSKGTTKAQITEALAEFWPHLPLDRTMRWNEDIRDAVLVGICTLEEHS